MESKSAGEREDPGTQLPGQTGLLSNWATGEFSLPFFCFSIVVTFDQF